MSQEFHEFPIKKPAFRFGFSHSFPFLLGTSRTFPTGKKDPDPRHSSTIAHKELEAAVGEPVGGATVKNDGLQQVTPPITVFFRCL